MSASADHDSRASAAPRSSPVRGLLLLGGTLLTVFVLLLAVEGGLRASGLGDRNPALTSRLGYQQVYPPMLVPGERPDGTPVLRTVDRRVPWQAVLREKPAGALRILCVGGSATAGLGYGPNVTYPRQLERMLRAACPEREIEVVNLGIVAISSRQVLRIVEDLCAHAAPDLIVVYSGNNEFLEVHASKFQAARMGARERLMKRFAETNFYRLLTGGERVGDVRDVLSVREMASADFRVSEAEMMDDVHLGTNEIRDIVDEYEANLRAMAAAGRASGTPILFARVASNWMWRGRQDMPADWVAERLGKPGPTTDADRRELLALFTAGTDPRVTQAAAWLRHFEHATLALELGEPDVAREHFRASMNTDPHLRRATDELGDRVAKVAAEVDAPYLDTTALLASRATHGIVGFDEFYDYVHFTPRGVLVVAAELFRRLEELNLLAGCKDFDEEAFAAAELDRLEHLEQDPFDVDRWLGLGFDNQRLHDRDLWKYGAALDELDAHLSANPNDLEALVWRANSNFFLIGGAEDSARDYAAALEIAPNQPEVLRNVELLNGPRRPE